LLNVLLIWKHDKLSREKYCAENGIEIDLPYGISYVQHGEKELNAEIGLDFRGLRAAIENHLARRCRRAERL
jgi:hypothetical protein